LAAARLVQARADLKQLADKHNLPVENILTPDYVRRVMWEPPTAEDADLAGAVAARLTELGARPWQVELTRDLLVEAIVSPPSPPVDPLPDADDEDLPDVG
jgi:ribonuclease D